MVWTHSRLGEAVDLGLEVLLVLHDRIISTVFAVVVRLLEVAGVLLTQVFCFWNWYWFGVLQGEILVHASYSNRVSKRKPGALHRASIIPERAIRRRVSLGVDLDYFHLLGVGLVLFFDQEFLAWDLRHGRITWVHICKHHFIFCVRAQNKVTGRTRLDTFLFI